MGGGKWRRGYDGDSVKGGGGFGGGFRGRVEEREEEAPRGERKGPGNGEEWGGMDVVSLIARSAQYRLGEQGRLQIGRLSHCTGEMVQCVHLYIRMAGLGVKCWW
jgi:hypothetical protein